MLRRKQAEGAKRDRTLNRRGGQNSHLYPLYQIYLTKLTTGGRGCPFRCSSTWGAVPRAFAAPELAPEGAALDRNRSAHVGAVDKIGDRSSAAADRSFLRRLAVLSE